MQVSDFKVLRKATSLIGADSINLKTVDGFLHGSATVGAYYISCRIGEIDSEVKAKIDINDLFSTALRGQTEVEILQDDGVVTFSNKKHTASLCYSEIDQEPDRVRNSGTAVSVDYINAISSILLNAQFGDASISDTTIRVYEKGIACYDSLHFSLYPKEIQGLDFTLSGKNWSVVQSLFDNDCTLSFEGELQAYNDDLFITIPIAQTMQENTDYLFDLVQDLTPYAKVENKAFADALQTHTNHEIITITSGIGSVLLESNSRNIKVLQSSIDANVKKDFSVKLTVSMLNDIVVNAVGKFSTIYINENMFYITNLIDEGKVYYGCNTI